MSTTEKTQVKKFAEEEGFAPQAVGKVLFHALRIDEVPSVTIEPLALGITSGIGAFDSQGEVVSKLTALQESPTRRQIEVVAPWLLEEDEEDKQDPDLQELSEEEKLDCEKRFFQTIIQDILDWVQS